VFEGKEAELVEVADAEENDAGGSSGIG